MFKVIQNIILYSSAIAVLFPLIVALINFKRYNVDLRILSGHLVIITALGMVATALWLFKHNNLPLLHIYTIAEFTMIAWFYHTVLYPILPPRLLPTVILLFCVFALVNAIFIQGWFRFNTIPRSIESIIIISLALLGYFKILSDNKLQHLKGITFFWINTGFLFYFSGALFLFTLSNYILPLNHRLNMYIWTIHAGISTLLYLFIFIGLWNYQKK